MHRRHVVLLRHIGIGVKQLQRFAEPADALPAALVEAGLTKATLVKLPVEIVVLGLLIGVAGQLRHKAQRIGVARSIRSRQVRRGGHHVGKRAGKARLASRRHCSWPPADRGHADAAVGQAAFDA